MKERQYFHQPFPFLRKRPLVLSMAFTSKSNLYHPMKSIPYCLAMLTLAGVPTFAAAPDLTVTSTKVETGSVAQAGSVTVATTVKNIGSALAGKSRVRIYLSKDPTKNAGDIRLAGYRAIPALGRGKSSTGSTKFSVPSACKPGLYYVIASADDIKDVKESRELNNTRKAVAKIKVTAENAVPDGFAIIPAGTFQMGDSVDGLEGPVREVFVSAFYMAKHEVTEAMWDNVRNWGLTHGYPDIPIGSQVYDRYEDNGSYISVSKGENYPIHSVSWFSVLMWCNARSEMEGLQPCYSVAGSVLRTDSQYSESLICNWRSNGYRLPTEAEWEKAARGGMAEKRFPWGNTISHSQANYASNSTYIYDLSGDPYWEKSFPIFRHYNPEFNDNPEPYIAPVGSFAPNSYGLYDLSGNISEFCWDKMMPYDFDSQIIDPHGPDKNGSPHVRRGGSWFDYAYSCQVSARSNDTPWGNLIDITTGFRLCRIVAP